MICGYDFLTPARIFFFKVCLISSTQNSGVDECHATIDWCEADSCYVICDLNSVHGTYVNDCRIHNATVRLSPGDKLHFGYGGPTYQLSIDSEKSVKILMFEQIKKWVSFSLYCMFQ